MKTLIMLFSSVCHYITFLLPPPGIESWAGRPGFNSRRVQARSRTYNGYWGLSPQGQSSKGVKLTTASMYR
jgi:hypothetical protein